MSYLCSELKGNVTENNNQHKVHHDHVDLERNETNLYREEDKVFGDEDFNYEYKDYEEGTRGDVGDPLQEDSDDDWFDW